jgi:hypothetical protein
MQTEAKLHPKLQIAVDRLNKRYSDITVKKYRTKDCRTGGQNEDGSLTTKEMIVSVELYTGIWEKSFAKLSVDHTYTPPTDHTFVVESDRINNQRSPKNEKRTVKDKIIVKLVDEFVRPFTYADRAKDILKAGHSALYWLDREVERKCSEIWKRMCNNGWSDVILDLIDGRIECATPELRQKAQELREEQQRSRWISSNCNDDKGSAMQVIAFQIGGDKWVLNVYGNGQAPIVTQYDSFDDLPDFIQQKVALLRIAPHKELLEDIGVKVEANSYFLYGSELQVLRKPNDSGEESKDQGNKTT